MRSALVIVSYYNGWPPDTLYCLLDQLHTVPSGYPFELGIVINQTGSQASEVPHRFGNIPVLTRKNIGYNIGAWEHGWRHFSSHDIYLFLQDECQLVRSGWLRAFVGSVSRSGVGLVGESLNLFTTWKFLESSFLSLTSPNAEFAGVKPDVFFQILDRFFLANGINKGLECDHLQSLVLCTRRDVLERIGGFPIGQSKAEAVAAEIGISKRVQSLGLQVRQIGLRPFEYVSHPQWAYRRTAEFNLPGMVRQCAFRWLTYRMRSALRRVIAPEWF